MIFTEKVIGDILKKNSTNETLQDGYSLYLTNSIREVEARGNVHIAYFNEKSTKTIVSLLSEKKVSYICSCRPDTNKLCRHAVAVLYHVMYNGKKEGLKLPEKPIKSNTSTFYTLKNYKKIGIKEIESLGTYEWKNSFFYERRFISLNTIKKGEFSFIYRNWGEAKNIDLRIEGDDLQVKCSCHQIVKNICQHEFVVLRALFLKEDKLLEFLAPVNYQKKLDEVAKLFGLPEHLNLEEYFELTVFDNQLAWKAIGKALGLKQLNEKISLPDSMKFLDVSTSMDNFAIGWAFTEKEERWMDFPYAALTPIVGKYNKDKSKLISPLRKYSETEYNLVTDTDIELVQLAQLCSVHTIAGLIQSNYKTKSNSEALVAKHFSKFTPRLSELLKSQKFVYFSNDNSYTFSDLKPLKINTESVKLYFELNEDELFYNMSLEIEVGDKKLSAEEKDELHFYFPFLLTDFINAYFITEASDSMLLLQYFEDVNNIKVVKSNFEKMYNNVIAPISEQYKVKNNLTSQQLKKIETKTTAKQVFISETSRFILLKPFVFYNNTKLINILHEGNSFDFQDQKIVEYQRDRELENEFLIFMKQLHPNFEKNFTSEFFFIEFDDFLENRWFLTVFELFKEQNIEVFGLKELTKFKYSQHKAKVRVNVSSGQDWFDVGIEVQFGDEYISLKDIRKAILKRENYIKLADGSLGILPEEWVEKLARYFRQGEIKKDGLKISKLRFNIIEELFNEQDYLEIFEEIEQKKAAIRNFNEIKNIEVPKQLKGELREYQYSGYHWLNFLDEFKWGGILADDMGLGKTIQVLSFLLSQKEKSKLPNLIIMPTTLLFNWEKEIEKFAPTLSYLLHYGNMRIKDSENFKNFDLILTSYGTFTRDVELLSKYKFNYVILDESQAIKNPDSLRFKAVSLLKAKNRLALTGTPIENNTFDLYAQMQFLNPGFLGTPTQFKENYSDAIDREQNPEIARELQKMINPFILRRTKEQVATELPPKTEDFLFCEMQTEQRKVYEAFKNKYRELLLNKIDQDGLGSSQIYILEGLTKLRQICDSPAILPDDENYGTDSIKIKELLRHIKEKTGKHKILIFSQFVKMLQLIKTELQNEKVEFEYLDGQCSQKDRQASVEHFQNDESCRVFLISLKAGGTGINLTAADYVYIIDPWWNPAVENQAIDRCYRIGQDKHVIAYRMICKGTIEEKIMSYQAKKRKIASDIISTDDAIVKQLNKQDIEDLFS